MYNGKHRYFLYLFFFACNFLFSQQSPLEKCWSKQVKPLSTNYLACSYEESAYKLNHSPVAWQQTNYKSSGKFWMQAKRFVKQDSIEFRQRKYTSTTDISATQMLFLDYGDEALSEVTEDMFLEQIYVNARYMPIQIINHFYQNKTKAIVTKDDVSVIYTLKIHKTDVQLHIRTSDQLLEKVTFLENDDLYGDVLTTIQYTSYTKKKAVDVPIMLFISKINGKLLDTVRISQIELVNKAPSLLDAPESYSHKVPEKETTIIRTEKYCDQIHFVELQHTDDRVMIVEFADFLLVAEAPLNSQNGELIIAEANKIAPEKPIKYFVFGHHHPHYVGGIRPFIHKGAEIISLKMNESYVRYIAEAQHTLQPDSLQLNPKPLNIQEIKDSLVLTDGSFEMKIYFIGEQSQHTTDYLIYYFPSEKLLFEDDLVWRKKEGEIKKASPREMGLYKSVKNLGLEVETIIQSWPVQNLSVKTIIPFSELEQAALLE